MLASKGGFIVNPVSYPDCVVIKPASEKRDGGAYTKDEKERPNQKPVKAQLNDERVKTMICIRNW